MFTSRRKVPKRIVREEETDAGKDGEEDNNHNGPVVRRPASTLPRTKSKLRMTYDPRENNSQDEPDDRTTAFPPKSRLGASTAASKSLSSSNYHNERLAEERPSYSRSHLDELRNSTPSTPRDFVPSPSAGPTTADSMTLMTTTPPPAALAVDVAAKFGPSSSSSTSAIPSAAEIREKKDRRARLAKEHAARDVDKDFISLDDYDDDGEFKPQRMQLSTYQSQGEGAESQKDTRLVRDDEDFAEGFDEFVEDTGRVTLGRQGAREQAKKDREAMRMMIDSAEGGHGHNYANGYEFSGSSDSASDSEAERSAAYELAQTGHGMDGLAAARETHRKHANRPRQPQITTPIPKLSAALSRLREAVQKIELEKGRIERRRVEIRTERAEIKERQAHIQQSLEQAGAELAEWQRKMAVEAESGTTTETHTITEPGMETGTETGTGTGTRTRTETEARQVGNESSTSAGRIERGLENMGHRGDVTMGDSE